MHDRIENGINDPLEKLRPKTAPPVKNERSNKREVMDEFKEIKKIWRNQNEAEINCSPIRDRIKKEHINYLISEIERLKEVIKQKNKSLYDIKMSLLNIYKAADRLTAGDVSRNIAWLKETITTLLERE